MGWWAKAARAGWLQGDALDEAIKRQIEIEPSLLTIRDHIQPGGDLILNGDRCCIILHFG